MIFSGIFEISDTKNTTGGASTWPQGWRVRPTPLGAPPDLVGPMWPPPVIPAPTHFIFLQKKILP